MSNDWLQSKLEAEPCFILEFSDQQQQLLLSRTKLEALCSALPALPFLLFGHPSMKKKVTERRSDNGIMVLTLMSRQRIQERKGLALAPLVDPAAALSGLRIVRVNGIWWP